ncbi:MAG: HIT family protein [Burkholderiaceae bacterium]
MNEKEDCPLCLGDGGRVVLRHPLLRIVHANENGFPGFYRVISQRHVQEFTSLAEPDRVLMMAAVGLLEELLREHLTPTKINLASLGNVVPHLHWHVIARFAWDSHFPAPVWSPPQRPVAAPECAELTQLLPAMERDLIQRFEQGSIK